MEYKLHVVLPQKFSLNQYERMFYIKRNVVKREFYDAILAAPRVGMRVPPPVDVHYLFKIYGAQLDVSNLMGMVKPLEDGLVRHGVFPDDNPKVVKRITIEEQIAPESSKKTKLSYCEITITPHKTAVS